MNANRFNDSFPTALEEQALAETREHFTEHLNQFSESQGEIRRIEKDLSRLALAVNLTTSRTAPSRNRFQTDDGASWYASVELMRNCWACYRPTAAGTEFAVVEMPASVGTPEILAKGRSAIEVVQAFARDQRQALKLWTEDVIAQVNEFLTQKYPGQDTSRVADGFMRRFTRSLSLKETFAQEQKNGRRIRI